jgi:hypothetical protein
MDKARWFDGVKMMWDGSEYATADEASAKRKEYEQEGFVVQTVSEDGKHFVFSRRVVREVVVTPS